MNKITLSTLILFLTGILSYGQNPQERTIVHVTGSVLEKETNQPLEYATLVFTPEKGKNVTGGITDEKGKFDIAVPTGTYTITVEFFSFHTKTLAKQTINQNLNLGTILLESDVQTLGEVEIIAEKSTVEVKLDKKIYNVGQDMTVKGGNAADVLDNVPSVTVDVDGNVSLRGNESVKILIDGKPSGLVGLSATDALRQLPADAIQKVEVITSPSARYDAEGTAGIINIVLRKGKVTGFNASYSLTLGIPENYGISTNLNYRAKKFNLFSNLGYNYRNSLGEAYFFNYLDSEDDKTSEEFRDTENLRKSFNGNVGLEYFLTDNASLTGSFLYRNAPGESNVKSDTYLYTTPTESTREELNEEDDDLMEYALNYTQKFKKDDHKWTIDVKYQDNMEGNQSFFNEYYTYPTNNFIDAEKSSTNDTQKDWLIKSDYVLPLGDKRQFEIGFQANLKDRSTDYKVFEYNGSQYVLNTDISNLLQNNENIYAAYVQYGTKFNKLSALFGLRMEATDLKVDGQETVEYPDLNFDKKYTNFFPTLNVTYELSDNENITFGYNRRIRRPHAHQLNPFQSRTSQTTIFQGNPGLDPVISDSYDIGYFKKWEKVTLNTSIYYNYANNAIQMIRESDPEDEINGIPIIYSRPINMSNEDRLGTELSINYSPTKAVQFSNSFNFFHYSTEGSYNDIDYSGENFSWFDRFSTKIKFSKKSDFQLSFMYMGPQETDQNLRKGMFSANAAYSLDVLKDNGTLSLNVSDIFNTRSREFYSYFGEFNSYAKMQWSKRQINLNFTYRFNQKKKQTRPAREDMNGGDEIMG
jgi:outer membrane receptor protein involved in Fe transport